MEGIFYNLRIQAKPKETNTYHWLQVQTDAEAATVVTDRQTDTYTTADPRACAPRVTICLMMTAPKPGTSNACRKIFQVQSI